MWEWLLEKLVKMWRGRDSSLSDEEEAQDEEDDDDDDEEEEETWAI